MKEHIFTALKGFLMGAANVVPGVSGGTMALITGIYSRIIGSLNSLTVPQTWKDLLHGRFRAFWKEIDGNFLLALGIGCILSIFSLAKFMTFAMERFPVCTWSLFFGLIVASAVLMFKDIKGWSWKEVVFALLGLALGVGICLLTPSQTTDALWFIFICGAIAICTMILPGISGSFILLILGKYDYIMQALDLGNFNLSVVAVFALGAVVGLLAFSKFLHWVLSKWEKQTMVLLLGFIVGSLLKVWPWQAEISAGISRPCLPTGDVALAILWCVTGAALVLGIDYLGKHGREQKRAA